MYANLCAGTNKERTDVEGSAALVCGDILLVETHHLGDHLLEKGGGNLGHHNTAAGALQACGILIHAEHTHLAVGAAVGLETFKGFLAIVQTGGCHGEVDGFFGAGFYFAPFAVAVITPHVVISSHIAELEVFPINSFHNHLFL